MRPPYVWLITDTHFYHFLMVQECGWPVDYQKKIISNCRRLVAPQDCLIHLGDVIFYKLPRLKGILEKIPGTKVLVKGNHDSKSNWWFRRQGFAMVSDMMVIGDVLFSHAPILHFPDGVVLNIHGHWHSYDPGEKLPWYRHFEKAYYKLDPLEMGFCPVRLDELRAQ